MVKQRRESRKEWVKLVNGKTNKKIVRHFTEEWCKNSSGNEI